MWDDSDVDWARYDLVVVRSAWDYAERWREFLRWAERVPRIENPLPVLAFGVDKERYLATLAAAGVPVVPTAFVRHHAEFSPPGEAFVVKPAISAGGRRSARFEGGDRRAERLVEEIAEHGGTAMVQPLLANVPESSLVYLDGRYSHALSRRAALPLARADEVLYLTEELGPHEATPTELEVSGAALALLPGPPLYARVDLLRGMVLELEVVEPSLYLSFSPSAADTLARAISVRLESDAEA